MAATVCHPALALPKHSFSIEDAKAKAEAVLGKDFPHIKKILRILENAGVQKRYLVQTLEESFAHEGLKSRNDLFIEESKRLGKQAAEAAMKNAGVTGEDIDLIITTSCTGFMIPSVCAYLLPELGMKRNTKRMPITELGCAAGAVSISRAREFCQTYPGSNVLIMSHELCSLTFQPDDFSMQAIVGGALFGDGVTAAVVRDAPVSGFEVAANDSYLFEDSWHYMGFDVRDSGFHLVLDKGIPGAVEKQIAPVFREFLANNDVTREDLDFFAIHPGGRKLVDELSRALEISEESNAPSRECLRDVGNLSSASVFVVLKNLFERHRPKAGEKGLLAAFGPGFSAEMSLGTWREA